MPYIGNKTADTTLVEDNSITSAKIVNDAVTVDKTNLISTGSVPSLEAKGTSGVTEGYIQLNCAENSHGIKLKSPPHSAGASYTLTFPNNDGNANQFLQTNGSGVLSFADAGGTNTPNFHAYNSASLDNSHNTYFLLRFNTEKFDTASAYNNTDYKFTVPSGQGGKYFIYSSARFSNNDGASQQIVQIYLDIRVNGSSTVFTGIDTDNGNFAKDRSVSGSMLINLSVGDNVRVYGFCETGNSANCRLLGGESSTYFGGYKIIE